MRVDELRNRILNDPIYASDGNHSARLWRVAENVQQRVLRDEPDDRLLHLMSRVGEFCRSLSSDLRAGNVTIEQVATLLDQMAEVGEVSFQDWRHRT